MKISKTTFQKVFPQAKVGIYEAIDKVIEQAGCITKAQQAMFLAQCGHESAGFTLFVENLNYREATLLAVFPKYFNSTNVKQYLGNPEKIANRAYANRLGNGTEASGDGFKYRGRGLIQLTGKVNYVAFEKWLGRDITADEVGQDLDLIVKTGVWYWLNRRLADYHSVTTVTKLINGGLNGLADREKKYNALLA